MILCVDGDEKKIKKCGFFGFGKKKVEDVIKLIFKIVVLLFINEKIFLLIR